MSDINFHSRFSYGFINLNPIFNSETGTITFENSDISKSAYESKFNISMQFKNYEISMFYLKKLIKLRVDDIKKKHCL